MKPKSNAKTLEELKKIASKSKLTMKDVMEFDKKIKAGMRKALDEEASKPHRKAPGPSTGTLSGKAQ